jgi:hypothetical protein
MFSRSLNDTSRVIRMTIIADTTTWSITYNCHSEDSRGVIYDGSIFVIRLKFDLIVKLFF